MKLQWDQDMVLIMGEKHLTNKVREELIIISDKYKNVIKKMDVTKFKHIENWELFKKSILRNIEQKYTVLLQYNYNKNKKTALITISGNKDQVSLAFSEIKLFKECFSDKIKLNATIKSFLINTPFKCSSDNVSINRSKDFIYFNSFDKPSMKNEIILYKEYIKENCPITSSINITLPMTRVLKKKLNYLKELGKQSSVQIKLERGKDKKSKIVFVGMSNAVNQAMKEVKVTCINEFKQHEISILKIFPDVPCMYKSFETMMQHKIKKINKDTDMHLYYHFKQKRCVPLCDGIY